MSKPYTGLATAPQHIRLEAFHGIDQETQRRVGTLVVLMAALEWRMELTLWLLTAEPLDRDRPPSTDKQPVSARLRRLEEAAAEIEDAELRTMFLDCLRIAGDLLVVRHTVVHGVPWGRSDGTAQLVRNLSTLGEARSRPTTTLIMSASALEDSADAADTVMRALVQIPGAASGMYPRELLLELGPAIQRAHSRMEQLRREVEGSPPG